VRVIAAPFKDRAALVTGAGSGIGAAIASGLLAGGAAVALLGRRPAPLERVAQAAGGGRALVLPGDVGLDADVRGAAARIERELGRLDVLVHAAGIIAIGEVAEAPVEDLDAQYRTNVRGPYALTRAVLPLLRAAAGQVVFVNSTAGRQARGGVAQYAATKHALHALADALRDEVNAAGVRVLSLYVGRTATPLQAALHVREGRPYRPERLIQPEDVASVVLHALALPPTVEMTEVTLRPLVKPAP
jgi:NADP-dependent 3-hydroxy acid dehydrogenase YdfG